MVRVRYMVWLTCDEKGGGGSEKTRETIQWHVYFVDALHMALGPVGIRVDAEVPMLKKPPSMDIVLSLPDKASLTEDQMARLCDGVRDVRASRIFIELKCTESVNESVLMKAMGGDAYGLSGLSLERKDIATFVISARTPTGEVIEKCGYRFVQPGVMRTELPCQRNITIISLNDLPNTPHNKIFKLFASKFTQKANAFAKIEEQLTWATPELLRMVQGLYRVIYKQELQMPRLSTQDLIKIGTEWVDSVVANAPTAQRLEGLSDEERLAGIPEEKRLEGISEEKRLQGISVEARVKGLSKEERDRLRELLDRH